MKTLLAAAAALALVSAPAFAQDGHAHHHTTSKAAADSGLDMSKMTPEQMRKHCADLADGKTQGQQAHHHHHQAAPASDAAPAAAKPGEAEMKAMHEACAAAMKATKKTTGD
ncbi:hypothetical protein [Phenylobacterium sp.]|jgi:hypothetical protein|uniref:hypothetical protein n=1 Tax=Phenylobacterium sp. TaxID=1871053 RepID=UPI002F9236C1